MSAAGFCSPFVPWQTHAQQWGKTQRPHAPSLSCGKCQLKALQVSAAAPVLPLLLGCFETNLGGFINTH